MTFSQSKRLTTTAAIERVMPFIKTIAAFCLLTLTLHSTQVLSLSLDAKEFDASRKMACVLAQQSLGRLTDDEYGEMTHSLLDGFGEDERDNILAQAVGYYGGLTFTIDGAEDEDFVNLKLEDFVASSTCAGGFRKVIFKL